jgi:hypothetical protein
VERFWSKVLVVDDTDSCWEWQRGTDDKGYGKFGVGGRGAGWQFAHRVGYELQVGPIPPDTDVLHHCDNPRCVRGSHLFLGDQKANMADMAAKGRQGRQNPTACPKGHPYPENARWYGKKKPNLTCVQCDNGRRRIN